MVTYVVDSNCFIHMGGMASTTILNDLKSALGTMHVTKGVHGEIQNVRYQRWKQKPNLLNHIKPLLTTHEVSESQIRGLGAKIGERASPQDVDLSLMVLAHDLQRDGHHVILVTDDFKMAKATEEHRLASEVCPPSTFFERLSTKAKGKHASELRRLGRRIRAAEMQYAISRRNEYDVQAKITWMVDSLLSSAPAKSAKPSIQTDGEAKVNLLNELHRMVNGENIKTNIRKKLTPLHPSCETMMELEHHVAKLKQKLSKESLDEIIIETQTMIADCLENAGIDLAPLDRELVDIAHRFQSRILVRAEMALAIMKRMKGDTVGSHLHLSTALFQATHVDEDLIEARILARLAVLALSTNKFEKAIRLSTSSLGLGTLSLQMKLKQHIVQAMAQYMADKLSKEAIKNAQTMVTEDVSMAAQALTELGESFLALNRPDFAIELFDEALECVSEVVPTPWLIDQSVLDRFNVDILMHGDDNSNLIHKDQLKILPRTSGISSTDIRNRVVQSLTQINNQKLMLTPGPAAVLHENIVNLKPLFGRGDSEYTKMAETVVEWIGRLSGQDEVVFAQGSATFGLELAAHSFVSGRVLLISTGYYS